MTGLVTVRPSGTPVFGLCSEPRSSTDSFSAWFTYAWTSGESFSRNTSGCSGAITKNVAPKRVSGRVVKTG